MRGGPDIGLRQVPTDALKRMLRHVHRGELPCPVTPLTIAAVRLQNYSGRLMNAMRGLDEAGVRAVLVNVLAERA